MKTAYFADNIIKHVIDCKGNTIWIVLIPITKRYLALYSSFAYPLRFRVDQTIYVIYISWLLTKFPCYNIILIVDPYIRFHLSIQRYKFWIMKILELDPFIHTMHLIAKMHSKIRIYISLYFLKNQSSLNWYFFII